MRLVSIAQTENKAEDAPEELMLYGRFVGDWVFDNEYYREDGSLEKSSGEWHFAWALEGRAIADLWTYPRLDERARTGAGPGGLGVTLRTYDPETSSWNVAWSAANGRFLLLKGRPVGEEIVQEGREEDGRPLRWIFSEIRPSSFLWRAESSADGGESWILTQVMRVRRTGGLPSATKASGRSGNRLFGKGDAKIPKGDTDGYIARVGGAAFVLGGGLQCLTR